MAGHRYYRLNITNNVGGVGYVAVRAFELAATPGGTNLALTGSGSAIASGTDAGSSPGYAFDTNVDTQWLYGNAGTWPQWLVWDFGATTAIMEARIVRTDGVGYNGSMLPKDGTIDCSDDGVTWTTMVTFAGLAGTVGVTSSFQLVPYSSQVDASLPMLTLEAGFGFSTDLSLPMLTADIDLGDSVDVTLPMLTLDSYGGSWVDSPLPMLTLDASVSDTVINSVDVNLPMLTLDTGFGAALDAVLPMLTFDGGMTGTVLIEVDLTLPMMTLDAAGTGSPFNVTLDIALPMVALDAAFGFGADFDLPMMTLDASITSGGLLTVDISLPMVDIDAAGTTQSLGTVDITLPMLVAMQGLTADFSLPMLQLDAQITAVVAVTYEAYAVNLKHNPQPGQQTQPIDEMTHYTNYPFTQIVRYKNSYYGVAADGLYLLEGTTDNGTPTTWDIQTAMHDWKTPLQKTAVSGYFGGRFGPQATVRLVAGDGKVSKSYAYTTPRGTRGQNYREFFGKGIRARYFALGATSSGELDLDNIETEVHNTTRRI